MTQSDIGIVEKLTFSHFTFQSDNKEVLRITAEGELIFADATEAAKALKREWDRLRTPDPIITEMVEALEEVQVALRNCVPVFPTVERKIEVIVAKVRGK